MIKKELDCREDCPYFKSNLMQQRPCASGYHSPKGGIECKGEISYLVAKIKEADPRIEEISFEIQGPILNPSLELFMNGNKAENDRGANFGRFVDGFLYLDFKDTTDQS